ncbi:Cysteinyl-tRNA_synthetase [Hexamita inflata]|uniref:cysteine--tRNA ligase n=1 Tax=Hexamita inflata TaxID=28002 RepID=A0ABP1JTC4_9EUKA
MQPTAKNSFTNVIEKLPESDIYRVYICGPTVYNSSHLGHARTYITFDVIRRILEQVFQKTVVYQMNITDIDDKIITRSNEQGISSEQLARKYEADFFADMDNLNIMRPTVVTRVTECMPAIIHFVQTIIDNGYGYMSNGSVYFDTQAFSAKGFQYPQLRYITQESQLEQLIAGDGISMKNRVDEKKSPNDFALWKGAKPGEPFWESPFGQGRPGWHIECSVMSNNVLVNEFNGFELHLGGKDLQFPHHANEVAQLEAFYNKSDQIEVFMHSGHLRIDNEVMSKSKMNFKTIADVLQNYTANQLRILFLQVDYASDINYSTNQLDYAVALDAKITQFINNISTIEKQVSPPELLPADMKLIKSMVNTKQAVKKAYAANFDYSTGFMAILSLLEETKQYMQTAFKPYVVHQLKNFIQAQLEVLGLVFSKNSEENSSLEVVKLLSEFRTTVKQIATGELTKVALLKACDEVRDNGLPPFGFQIEDKAGESVVKTINYQEFLKNQQRELLLKQEKEEKVRLQNLEKQKKLEEEMRLAQIPASEMFKSMPEYTEFDANGIPTKMKEGEEIVEVPKSKTKKLQKDQELRKKLNEKYAK